MNRKECSFEGCNRPVHVLKDGLCTGHYQQQYAGKELRPLKKKVMLRRPSDDTKICTECMSVKQLSEFYMHTEGGPFSKCKECMRQLETARRERRKAQKAREGV